MFDQTRPVFKCLIKSRHGGVLRVFSGKLKVASLSYSAKLFLAKKGLISRTLDHSFKPSPCLLFPIQSSQLEYEATKGVKRFCCLWSWDLYYTYGTKRQCASSFFLLLLLRSFSSVRPKSKKLIPSNYPSIRPSHQQFIDFSKRLPFEIYLASNIACWPVAVSFHSLGASQILFSWSLELDPF